MYIEQIRVQNFRILKDCTLDMRNDLRPHFLPVFGRVFIVSLINGDSTKKWRKLRGAGHKELARSFLRVMRLSYNHVVDEVLSH